MKAGASPRLRQTLLTPRETPRRVPLARLLIYDEYLQDHAPSVLKLGVQLFAPVIERVYGLGACIDIVYYRGSEERASVALARPGEAIVAERKEGRKEGKAFTPPTLPKTNPGPARASTSGRKTCARTFLLSASVFFSLFFFFNSRYVAPPALYYTANTNGTKKFANTRESVSSRWLTAPAAAAARG